MIEYAVIKDYREDDELRRSFNSLAGETFGLSFENWYKSGYWGQQYIPYSVVSEGEIVSNVSMNLIDCVLQGKERHYIQLGTVMTKKSFRGRGYCKMLMEAIQRDYALCDGLFLYANDSVLDFYPRFGFRRMKEYRCNADWKNEGAFSAVHVPMETPEDWNRFLVEKNRRFGNGLLDMKTDDLMMFYLTQFMRENVFYVPREDAIVIAENVGDTLVVYDIYSTHLADLKAVCGAFGKTIRKVRFAFTPHEASGLRREEWSEEDTTFFVLGDGLAQDMETIGSFPALAHA